MALTRLRTGGIAANAVVAASIAPGAVDITDIADGAVTEAKLATNAVVAAKIEANAVTSTQIASGAVEQYLNDNSVQLFFKNRIINGDMRIDQRNAGANVTLTSGGNYTVDRFKGFEDTDGAMTAQQDSSAPAGFVNSTKLTTTTADGTLGASQFAIFRQGIEGTNIADLAWGTANAKTVTLSFFVRSSLTGTFGGAINNNAFNRSYPFTYSISVADTFEYKTIEIEGDVTGTWLTTTDTGMNVDFGLGVGSANSGTADAWAGSGFLSATGAVSVIGTLNATWYITGVQLEVGSVATPFERRPFGTELSLCQRYFQSVFLASNGLIGFADQTTSSLNMYYAPTTMRAAPTLNTTGTAANYQIRRPGVAATVCSGVPTLSATSSDNQQFRIDSPVASGLTAGNGTLLNNAGGEVPLSFSAEL